MAQKWEYGIVQARTNDQDFWRVDASYGSVPSQAGGAPSALDKYLDTAGNEGWELTGTVGDSRRAALFFKRPK